MTLYQECSSHHDASNNMDPIEGPGVGRGGGDLISPFNIFIESLKIRFKKKKKKKRKQHEALLAIYGIATPFYRTLTSLLNIQFIRKSYGSELG